MGSDVSANLTITSLVIQIDHLSQSSTDLITKSKENRAYLKNKLSVFLHVPHAIPACRFGLIHHEI